MVSGKWANAEGAIVPPGCPLFALAAPKCGEAARRGGIRAEVRAMRGSASTDHDACTPRAGAGSEPGGRRSLLQGVRTPERQGQARLAGGGSLLFQHGYRTAGL
jgi:hypothetical protein